MSGNRKRNRTLTIRLTAAEKDAIARNAAKTRMSLTDFIVTSALSAEIYAIPEEWRLAEKKLLEEAVKFQPELYRQIRQLATRQEFQQMQDQQLHTIQMEQQEQMRAIRSTLQQDGSVREKYSSDISKLLSDGRRDMQQFAKRLEKKIRNMILAAMAASMVLSILVCLVLRYLIG